MERLERRWSTRKNLCLDVDLQVPSHNNTVVPATLLDISLGGAFIGTQVLLQANTALTIKLKLPGNFVRNNFRLKVRIVRSTPQGVGVSFVDVRAGVINALIEALSRNEKTPKPFRPIVLPGFVLNKGFAA